MGDRVELGDTVRFEFSTHPPMQGVLLHTPAATGDSWIIRQDGGTLVYVQQFDYMHQIRERDGPF